MSEKKNHKIERVEKLPDSEAKIIGEISLDFLNSCRKDALKHLNSHLSLPGFRKGLVPDDILIKTLGEGAVLAESAEVAIAKAYGEIILESGLKPITRPEIKITKRQMKIMEELIKATEIKFPERFVESESTHMLAHFKEDIKKAGIKWEEYLDKVKKSEEEVRDSFKEQIIYRAKAELIVMKIAEKENLKTYGEVFDLLEKQEPASASRFRLISFPSDSKSIMPCSEVSTISPPADSRIFKTSECGCPYELSLPAEMTEYSGETASANESEVEVREPWCPTFKTSASISCGREIKMFSVLIPASPVKRKEDSP